MKARHWFIRSAFAVGVMAGMAAAAEAPITLTFFHEPGCDACEYIDKVVLPAVADERQGQIAIDRRDLNIASNYLELVRWQEIFGNRQNEPVYVLLAKHALLGGVDDINKNLRPAITAARSVWQSGQPPGLPGTSAPTVPADYLSSRLQKFTIPAVMLAGLIDGLNPCAVSTLVFFISMTAVAGLRGRRLWTAGSCFCAASFATNMVLGFGLLGCLRRLSGFALAQTILEMILIVLLAILAAISWLDAWRYYFTGRPGAVLLQTPAWIRNYLHCQIHRLGKHNADIAVTAVLLGMLVTLLESVCTGQVYVPTLVLVIKTGHAFISAAAMLLLYNLMFVLPLVGVFILICRGLDFQALLAWSRRNVVLSKILLGFLFLLLGGMIFVMRGGMFE